MPDNLDTQKPKITVTQGDKVIYSGNSLEDAYKAGEKALDKKNK